MNSLSVLIYISYITDKLSDFFIFLMAAAGVICVVLAIVSAILYFDDTDGSYKKLSSAELDNRREVVVPKFRKYMIIGLITFFVSGIVQSILPDRNTVLLIAASQIGEKIVNNEKVQSVVDPSIDLLKTWMVKQTAELKKSMEQPSNQSK